MDRPLDAQIVYRKLVRRQGGIGQSVQILIDIVGVVHGFHHDIAAAPGEVFLDLRLDLLAGLSRVIAALFQLCGLRVIVCFPVRAMLVEQPFDLFVVVLPRGHGEIGCVEGTVEPAEALQLRIEFVVPCGELDLSLTDRGGCFAPPGALGAAELGERRLFVYQNRIELGLVKKSGQILGQVLIHVFFGLLAELLQLLHRTWLLRPGGPRGQITLNQKIVGDLNGGERRNGGILCVSQVAALLLCILPDRPPRVG